ncbi:MAG: aminotransferase class I/II-fold pyridoxal phosphate-dependent enzyme [Kiritimatiellae bacterium]|nr:aminotransferase class I/II-fold pyridoxal phosphate-dependent enzyme [Kiritimatiellia bacterium]
MRSLSVLWLHRKTQADEKALPLIEYALSDAFKDFCQSVFNVHAPLEYPPLHLAVVENADELPLSQRIDMCLFMVDDDLMSSYVGESTLKEYLGVYFPQIPRVVVAYPGHRRVAVPQRRWTKKPAAFFYHAARHHDRLVHLFKSFWMPRFWTALRQYVATKAGTAWHTPGHSGGSAFSSSPFLRGFSEAFGPMIFRSDLSVSVESLGDLSAPEAHTPLSEAQKLSSEIFGTALSCYVTNGTSTSNKAMLMTLLKPGEVVLVDHNCHKSVHHAIVMSGAIPRYLPGRWNASLGVWGPAALADIEGALCEKGDKPRLLILTTCTYEGVLYPVWEIARICEREGVLFYADEAWAGHLGFHPHYTRKGEDDEIFRYSATDAYCGAHFAVQSTHKILSAFSQASMIHVSPRFKALLEDDARSQFRWLRRRFAFHGHGSFEKFTHDLREFLRYWHSTSPHYPFLATLDIAGVQMRLEGMKLVDERLKWVADFRKRVALAVGKPESECFADIGDIAGRGSWAEDGYAKDPLKIVIMLKNPEACKAFRQALLKAHIQWEKSTSTTVLFLVTVGTLEEHFEDLFRVVRLSKVLIGRPQRSSCGKMQSLDASFSGAPAVSPHAAALCDGELVRVEDAAGRIASQFLVPYPPGIPVMKPGFRITEEDVQIVKNVIAAEGCDAVHGLFCRGGHAPYYVEVLNADEERRLL